MFFSHQRIVVMKKILIILGIFLLFFSGKSSWTVEGFKPLYVPAEEAKVIKLMEPAEMVTQGKIYVKDNYIYVGDVNKGIHIIDNTDPSAPVKVAFLQIYGNHDIAIKGNMLYADNLEDLITIDISNRENPVVVSRIEDVYKTPNQNFPEDLPYHTWFECADPDKGYVIGWIPATIESPDCYTGY